MAKFKDPDTGDIVDVPIVRTKFKDSGKIYCDGSGMQLLNKNGKPLIEVPRSEWDPNYDPTDLPTIGKFAMASKEDKQKILKKRSNEHFKKEVREVQANANGETGKQF